MKFALQQPVIIKISKQSGEVTARAEYINNEPCYRVDFLDAQGNPRSEWFDESRLEAAEEAGATTA
jgi:hypothetical protein